MRKESLLTLTSANLIKKALPLGARLLGFTLVLSASVDKYHDDPFLDKNQNEPINQKSLSGIESPEFEFSIIDQEKKVPESLAFISYSVKLLEPQTPQIQISLIEQKIEQYKVKLDGIEKKMILRKDLFSEQDFEDLRIYYPIYAAASEKYNIPWYLLWITHKAESTVSRDTKAFKPARVHYGSMQRAVDVYSKEDVHAAAAGLEFLAALPQRHYDDWEEIVWAASKLRRDQDVSGSLLSALYSYVVDGESAEFRYQQFLLFSQIFEQKSKLK